MEPLSELLDIGLTEGEAKAYAALLELGSSTVGPITKRTGISYSNIYEILERLMEKGIATVIVRGKVRHFQAVSPGNLVNYLDKKEKMLTDQRRQLMKALPRIEALQESRPKQEAMLFTGFKGLRSAYETFFKGADENDENLWIYVHEGSWAEKSDQFYLQHWHDLIGNLKSRGLADESYRSSRFIKEWRKRYEVRFVDFPLFSHGEVLGDQFLLISWEDPITAVLVHAKHVSENFRKYFESIWKIAKKP